MRNLVFALMLLCSETAAARAQDLVTADMLIRQGYEVKAAYGVPSYSQFSVLYLQKGSTLYICSIASARGGPPQASDVASASCAPV
jgi:hypothetical protein